MSLNLFVPLDRRFVPAPGGEPDESSEYARELGLIDGTLGWDELLERRRVVLLAEGGSGKSTELEEQARQRRAAGEFAFFATIQNVARAGFDTALHALQADLHAWRASSKPAWFFLDSVDEAKSAQVRLRDALEVIAQGIKGAEGRAYIVLSGRHSDWEARGDLVQLEKALSLPAPDAPLPAIDPNALIAQVVRREKPKKAPPAETTLIVMMAELDRERVRRFAQAQGVSDVEDFLAAIDDADLWRFARRPLDLAWLIDEWRQHKAFEPLAKMLERSLRHRLRETDLHRARQDSLDERRAFEALERIGAALVLQKLDYVEVPDSTLDLAEQRRGLRLSDVLPDWPERDRVLLINRAAFDPVVPGLVRLHNDNRGDVRGFLAARWFRRLLDANCPYSAVADRLFASTYDIAIIVPSLRETTAWLSLWDDRIALEVVRREPDLLMNAGDPGSLPLTTREEILRRVAAATRGRRRFEYANEDHLKRLVREDVAALIRELWQQHGDSVAGRMMLLRLIELGRLGRCADLAVQAAFRAWQDPFTAVFSGRALMAVGSSAEKRRYAQHVVAQADALEPAVVWDAVEELFPQELSVEDFILIAWKLDLTSQGHWRFDSLSRKLPAQLTDVAQLEKLATAFTDRIGKETEEDEAGDRNEPFHNGLEVLALRIFERLALSETSKVAMKATCTVMRRETSRKRNEELRSASMASVPRRRALLWFARDFFRGSDRLQSEYARELWNFQILGLPFTLQAEDVEWLLEDVRTRATADERHLAADTLMRLRHEHSLGEDVIEKLRAAGAGHSEVEEVITAGTQPRERTEEQKRRDQRVREVKKRNAIQVAQSEKSWMDFAERIRADPERYRTLPPPAPKSMDAGLYNVAELLFTLGENRNRHSISSLEALAPLFDSSVRSALEEGFVRFWRSWKPTLLSERPPHERNRIHNFDRIGIIGVSLEAARSPNWAQALSHEDALRAAGYATLELNGFPDWFECLARAQPAAVREVLVQELTAELAAPLGSHPDTLSDIAAGPGEIQSLMAPFLFERLAQGAALDAGILNWVIDVLVNGFADKAKLAAYLEGRVQALAATDPLFSMFLAPLFRLAPQSAQLALTRKLRKLKRAEQTRVIQRVLPAISGNGYSEGPVPLSQVPFATLLDLTRTAFRTLRPEEDNDHSDGKTFSPDGRDHAEGARSALFRAVVETPGLATFEALRRFQHDRTITLDAARLEELALERAAKDSETAAWTSDDVVRFEADFLTVPRNASDLHRTVSCRLRDLQHDLLHADFSQGPELARAPKEEDVQNLVARELRVRQGRSYSLEREAHAVEEKEPDVRFRTKVSDASVPMEIKVAETWSYRELVDALVKQLIGQYLRAREDRHGVLLIVHQRPRPQGWRSPSGKWLPFAQLRAELTARARKIAGESPDAPQVTVEVLDVSSITLPSRKNKPAGRAKAGTSRKGKTVQAAKAARKQTVPRKAKASRHASAKKRSAQHRR